jgi:hypothetical protein
VTPRRLAGLLLVVVGAGAVAMCLRSLYAGMRDVMVTDGGSCGSGGPYVVAHACSGSDTRLLLVGIFGGLVATAVLAGGTGLLGLDMPAGLLAWAAMFGALGWNFVSLGAHPGAGQSGSGGWLICGVVFWLLALGGLVPAVGRIRGELGGSRHPDPAITAMQPLVRAVQVPGLGTPQDGRPAGPPVDATSWFAGNGGYPGAQSTVAPGTGAQPLTGWLWLAAVTAGAVAGVLAGAAFATLLR